MNNEIEIYSAGEHAITVKFGEVINPLVNNKVISFFHYLKANPFTGLTGIIPAYTTLTVTYDVIAIVTGMQGFKTAADFVAHQLQQALAYVKAVQHGDQRTINIPVCYHPSLAPDIVWLANEKGLSVKEVTDIHAATTYQVYMLGFLPGFPYMASVDERIQVPRKNSPRKKVAAGCVGIAGLQTGIYPFDSPGGWQLIGQTPLKIFDAQREQPALFQPGDHVRFVPINLEQFNSTARWP